MIQTDITATPGDALSLVLEVDQDGTLDFTIPKRPIRKVHKGLPAFTTLRGGAYFFLPGLTALRHLSKLGQQGAS